MSTNIKHQVSSIRYQVKDFTFIRRRVGANPLGFTLIELLIVVAIISILVSIGAVSFQRVQQQGRDTQRKADLAEVASALEQFYGDNNAYPKDNGGSGQIMCGLTAVTWDGTSNGSFCTTPIYLNPLPTSPGTSSYFYDAQDVSGLLACDNDPTSPTPSCQRFVVSGTLEGTVPTSLNCTPETSGTFNFCVRNP